MASSQERFGDDFGAERMWGLRELPLPEAPSLWPPAPGWYVVAAILLLLIAYFSWRHYRAWQRDQYRRDALADLSSISAGTDESRRVPIVLRRTALNAYPRAEVASLRGMEWIAWLNGSAAQDIFAGEDAETLDSLAYAPATKLPAPEQVERLILAVTQWTRRHRAGV